MYVKYAMGGIQPVEDKWRIKATKTSIANAKKREVTMILHYFYGKVILAQDKGLCRWPQATKREDKEQGKQIITPSGTGLSYNYILLWGFPECHVASLTSLNIFQSIFLYVVSFPGCRTCFLNCLLKST